MMDEEPGERILALPSSFQGQGGPLLVRIPVVHFCPSPFASSYRVSTLHGRCHQPSQGGYGVSIRSLPCLPASIRRSYLLPVQLVFRDRSSLCASASERGWIPNADDVC